MLDCIVIGAGAAGIGAGLALLRANASFVVLEAKDRVGGRAYSESESIGQLWDHGCHWFHSASKNPLREIALKLQHPFVDAPVPYGAKVWINGDWQSIDPLYDAFGEVLRRADNQLQAGGDIPLSNVMGNAGPLEPILRHEFALNTSHEPEEISARDLLNFDDTGENTPVAGGYGALIVRLAGALPIQLGVAVRSIDVQRDHVRVETPKGTLEARTVVLAVPQRVLESGMIKFTPRLPTAIEDAIAALPMGWFEKAAFAFDKPMFGDLVGSGAEILVQSNGRTFPAGFGFFAGEPAFAVCHTGGHLARDLGATERMALCGEALVSAFGSDLRKHIMRQVTTGWTADRFIGGAYSIARPGMAHARQVLHAPVHERLFLAGEHTSLTAMATAHGAYLSGINAVQRAFAALGRAIDVDPLWVPEQA